jgi:hypothetical protein
MIMMHTWRALTIVSYTLLFSSQLASSQSLVPSNDTSALHPPSDLSLFVSPSLGGMVFKLEPLSTNAGLGAPSGVSIVQDVISIND